MRAVVELHKSYRTIARSSLFPSSGACVSRMAAWGARCGHRTEVWWDRRLRSISCTEVQTVCNAVSIKHEIDLVFMVGSSSSSEWTFIWRGAWGLPFDLHDRLGGLVVPELTRAAVKKRMEVFVLWLWCLQIDRSTKDVYCDCSDGWQQLAFFLDQTLEMSHTVGEWTGHWTAWWIQEQKPS